MPSLRRHDYSQHAVQSSERLESLRAQAELGGGDARIAQRRLTVRERLPLDDVIEPHETRPRLIAALRSLAGKRDVNPRKKHGNIPL